MDIATVTCASKQGHMSRAMAPYFSLKSESASNLEFRSKDASEVVPPLMMRLSNTGEAVPYSCPFPEFRTLTAAQYSGTDTL